MLLLLDIGNTHTHLGLADDGGVRKQAHLKTALWRSGEAGGPVLRFVGKARIVGVEPAGGAAVARGVPGVVHGMKSYLMQDEYGQVLEAHSISAGLDYPGIGPEHSYLSSIGRVEYPNVTDAEVIEAFQVLSRREGIIPALEPAHGLAWILREAKNMQGRTVLLNLSGRGDKDVGQMMDVLGK